MRRVARCTPSLVSEKCNGVERRGLVGGEGLRTKDFGFFRKLLTCSSSFFTDLSPELVYKYWLFKTIIGESTVRFD